MFNRFEYANNMSVNIPACILWNSFLLLQRSSGDDSSTGGDSEENEGKDKEVSDFDIHSEAKSLQKVTNYTTTSLNKKMPIGRNFSLLPCLLLCKLFLEKRVIDWRVNCACTEIYAELSS